MSERNLYDWNLVGVENVYRYKKNNDGTYVINDKNERVTEIVSSEDEGLKAFLSYLSNHTT